MTIDPIAYDTWKTAAPEADEYMVRCDVCDYEDDYSEDGACCSDCGDGILFIVEPFAPCSCTTNCYC